MAIAQVTAISTAQGRSANPFFYPKRFNPYPVLLGNFGEFLVVSTGRFQKAELSDFFAL
ncbi:hypothetical protein [Streptomyces hoynatensis]|uniref:hypothetical protein n=1 Tax=Streptomyces hoynatensis TaxID=1141874 RepID=UPI001319D27E|nr:hypothetical protein [Streptomyces hoynatensis]